MENPYQASPDTSSTHDGLQRVITGQRMLIFSIMGYLCASPLLIASNAFLEGTEEKPVVTVAFVAALAVGLIAMFIAAVCASVGIFRMGGVLFPGSTRYVYAIGVLIPAPFIGLLVMFVANSKATGYLKAHGIDVGFFGAKTKSR